MNNLKNVVIIGRINVGKSALFNRLTESSKAIVSKVPGTTRDYNLAIVEWQGKFFNLIDTGGVDSDLVKHSIQSLISKKFKAKPKTNNPIEIEIIKQTKTALQKAELILLVVDGQVGVMPQDHQLALTLQKIKKPIILVCNKVDNPKVQFQSATFYKLGLGQPMTVSAVNGSGSGDLLDAIIKKIKVEDKATTGEDELPTIKIAIIGRPNVGKSSLVNKIVGEQRVIVSPIAQTTREPQNTELIYKDHKIVLIDTAGLRKQGKIEAGLEKQATRRTLDVLKRADVALLITEAQERLGSQDAHLAGLLKDTKTGIIIIGNKWDILKNKTPSIDVEMNKYYRGFFPFLSYAPILFISALTGRNVEKILDNVIAVWQQKNKKIDDEVLDKLIKRVVKQKRPVQAKGSLRPHVYSLVQSKTNPPLFTVTLGRGQNLHFSYLRFIENQLRKSFDFFGTPVTITVRAPKK